MQQGCKKMPDFKRIKLTKETQDKGDKICQLCNDNPVLTKDRLTGRLGEGLKNFYKNHDSNLKVVQDVLNAIDKDKWETYFVAQGGRSMEVKAFKGLVKLKDNAKLSDELKKVTENKFITLLKGGSLLDN